MKRILLAIPVLVLILAAGGTGCSRPRFADQGKLEGLRILAIRADQPEAAAGDTVTLTPYLSDVTGAGRTLRYSAEGCIDPGRGSGSDISCEGSISRQTIVSDAAVAGLDASMAYTSAVSSTVPVTLPASAVIFANRRTEDQYNGITYLVIYRVWSADGAASIKSVKRILVSTRAASDRNLNPTLDGLRIDGTEPAALLEGVQLFSAACSVSSFQSYPVQKRDLSFYSRTENLTTEWYSSDGEWAALKTEAAETNSYTPSVNRPSDRKVVLVGVVKDGRGGVDVRILGF